MTAFSLCFIIPNLFSIVNVRLLALYLLKEECHFYFSVCSFFSLSAYISNLVEYGVILSSQLLPGLLCFGVILVVRIPSMDQIDLFKNYLYLIGILDTM